MKTLLTFSFLGALLLGFASPAHADELEEVPEADGLTLTPFRTNLDDPTGFDWLPDGRMIVSLRAGGVVILSADGTTEVDAGSFSGVNTMGERGLLSVQVDPDFENTRALYFFASTNTASNRNVVYKTTLGQDDMVDTSDPEVLVEQLYASDSAIYHNGGALQISADGEYLYISTGDSTTPSNSECLTNGAGKIHRVALNGDDPATNPLVGETSVSCGGNSGAPRESLFAWGFRNPYRMWVHPGTGNLWVGDVGDLSGDPEEVNVIPPEGGLLNYGWAGCNTTTPASTCVDAVYDYPNTGSALIGGVITDSCVWPEGLKNRYIFGDYVDAQIYSIAVNATFDGVTGTHVTIATTGGNNTGPVNFGLGPDGAVYYSTLDGNDIQRIFPESPIDCDPGAGGAGGSGGGGAGGSAGSAGAGGASGGSAGSSSDSGGSAGTASGSGGSTATGGSAAGGTTGGASASGAGGSAPKAAESEEEGGCGCRMAGAPSRGVFAGLVTALGAAALLRRSHRRR